MLAIDYVRSVGLQWWYINITITILDEDNPASKMSVF
jgi:hypothetical protein